MQCKVDELYQRELNRLILKSHLTVTLPCGSTLPKTSKMRFSGTYDAQMSKMTLVKPVRVRIHVREFLKYTDLGIFDRT